MTQTETIASPPSRALADACAASIPVRTRTSNRRLKAKWYDLDQLETQVNAWNDLADNSVWHNVSYESNYLIPALQNLAGDSVRTLVVEDELADRTRNLVALAPIEFTRKYGLPWKCAEIWNHSQCFDATPLLSSEHACQAWRLICETLAAEGCSLLSLDTVSAATDFEQVLETVQLELQMYRFQRDWFCRAAFLPASSAEEYYQRFVSKTLNKNLRRLARRLAELGVVEWQEANDQSDFELLAEQFLELEASGWKGREGTALASNDSTRQFYRELIRTSAVAGKARFLTLSLDNRPVAMLSDIQSGANVYSFKTAYDESLAKYSPGLQLELKNIEFLHRSGIEFGDSCTASDNAAINRIWGQQVAFQHVVFSLKPGLSRTAVRMLPILKTVIQKIRPK